MLQQPGGSEMGSGDDFAQVLAEQVVELVGAIVDGIRERPSVALAIAAAAAGALVGLLLAGRLARPKPRPTPLSEAAELLGAIIAALGSADLGRRGKPLADLLGGPAASARARSGRLVPDLGRLGNAADLAGTALRLLENPLVRAYVRGLVASQVRRRFARP